MGTKSKYQVTVNHLVREVDLPQLSSELRQDFQDICNSIFVEDPYKVAKFGAMVCNILI